MKQPVQLMELVRSTTTTVQFFSSFSLSLSFAAAAAYYSLSIHHNHNSLTGTQLANLLIWLKRALFCLALVACCLLNMSKQLASAALVVVVGN